MKHKHYDMIIAKAANMDLVMFMNYGSQWVEVSEQLPIAQGECYFLCLPQHKEACLHSLNGGVAQAESSGEMLEHALREAEWDCNDWYMSEDFESRIKPKTEKRWIVYSTKLKRLGVLSFCSKQEARAHYSHDIKEPQFIEIEVEVK